MSEAEYDRLLEAVKMAIEPAPQEYFLAQLPVHDEPQEAANDNRQAWPSDSVSRGLVRLLLIGARPVSGSPKVNASHWLDCSRPSQPWPSPSPYSR